MKKHESKPFIENLFSPPHLDTNICAVTACLRGLVKCAAVINNDSKKAQS